ncbi:MAG: hypothetical protein M1824_003644 [Vezdaea acicularis]|nr:MAG: hypothetical protein M1824_003644 [Vezdaea acicularis]
MAPLPLEKPRLRRLDTSNSTSPASSSTVSPTQEFGKAGRLSAFKERQPRRTEAQQYLDRYRLGNPSPHRGPDEGESEHTSTPPINVPTPPNSGVDTFVDDEAPPLNRDENSSPFEEAFRRSRNTSISFSPNVTTSGGGQYELEKRLPKAERRIRGRSMLQELADSMSYRPLTRAHSESHRWEYDPETGQHINRTSRRTKNSEKRQKYHKGEANYPLLQSTVDELAAKDAGAPGMQSSAPVKVQSGEGGADRQEPVREPEQMDFVRSPMTSSIPPPISLEDTMAWPATRMRYPNRRVQSFGVTEPRLRRGALRAQSSSSAKSPAQDFLSNYSPISPSQLLEEQEVGDYQIGKKIGYGGFSTVREAHTVENGVGITRAVKIVRRQVDGRQDDENEQLQDNFKQEVELWRGLHHRYILPLIAVYYTPLATYCVMERYVHGTLFDLISVNRQGLRGDIARRYSYQLASAICYLHEEKRIVHRDVKLENCLLDKSEADAEETGGNVILCDFGMAAPISPESTYDRQSALLPPYDPVSDHLSTRNIGPSATSTSIAGSLQYAAPEVLDAPAGLHNPATDIWAYGVVVYALLVGNLPFRGRFEPGVIMMILRGEWNEDNLRHAPGVVGTEEYAVELVRGCLETDQEARWDIRQVLSCDWLEDCESQFGDRGAWKPFE